MASKTIEAGISSEVSTVIWADRFGRISPNMIRASEAPRARAASMNSRRLSEITCPRITRATAANEKNAIIRIVMVSPAVTEASWNVVASMMATSR